LISLFEERYISPVSLPSKIAPVTRFISKEQISSSEGIIPSHSPVVIL